MSRTFAYPGGVHNTTPQRVVFGAGAIACLPDELDRLSVDHVLVVTTPGRAPLGERATALLSDRSATLLPEAVSQVPIELARRGQEKAIGLEVDGLVAVGGGAAVGLAKGIAYGTGLPIVAVPTTYAGSEMTGFCGMTIDGVKRMHRSPAMIPSTVVYDPELSRTLPARTTAASAMNALAHCIDAIYLPTMSPLLAPAAVDGARAVTAALPAAVADPCDLHARTELLYGAYLAGAALTGGFALQHAIAHVLGGSFGVDHGVAHAVVLPYVTAHLVARAPAALRPIADAVGTDDLAGHVWDLVAGVGLPTRLADVGLDADDLDRAVKIAATADDHDDDDPALTAGRTNPAPVTEQAVTEVMTAAAAGARPRGSGP